MEIDNLLDTLEDIMNKSKSVPFTDKVVVERDVIIDIIREIKLKMPDELKQARWIKEERERILAEAQKDADDIVKEAENRIISMIDEHEITKKAYDKKNEIIVEANEMYRDIVKDSNKYADNILANIEDSLTKIEESLSSVGISIQNSIETIQNNRKELK